MLFSFCFFVPIAQAAPEVGKTTFSGATSDSAVLKAEVNPKGKPTQYHFEYGLADCSSSACASTPNVTLPTGSAFVAVEVEIKGLEASTTYHFRVVAKNIEGTANGPDRSFTTHLPPPIFPTCPNDAFRIKPPQPSAILPDCRAYEQASPIDKSGLDARAVVAFAKASVEGNRITFAPAGGMPGAEGAQDFPVYLSTRSGGNWSTQGLLPPGASGQEASVLGWTTDFATVFDSARLFSESANGTLMARSSEGGGTTTIVPYGSGFQSPSYAGSSADGSKFLFESESDLASVPVSLEGKSNLYLWDRDTGTITLAGALNGEPSPVAPPGGAFAGAYSWIEGTTPATLSGGGAAANQYTTDQHVISADGKSVYFTAGETGQVYLRRNPTQPQSPLNGEGKCTNPALACTIHVSASQRTPVDPVGTQPAAFLGATADGSVAFLSSSEKLTSDANTGPEREAAAIKQADINDPNNASKRLDLLLTDARGIAVDGTYVYWADPKRDSIGRAELNGGDLKPEFIDIPPIEIEAGVLFEANPQYVTVDGSHVYWTNATDGKREHGTIGRAELDSTEAKEKLITGATNPQGIDAEGEFIYWGNAGEEDATRTLGRAKLDGGEADQGFIEVGGGEGAKNTPQGIAVNSTHIYMAIKATQNISYLFRFKINGDLGSKLLFFENVDGLNVRGITLDSTYVYWARQGKNTIGRIPLDLDPTKAEPEWLKEADRPLGVAVNAEHVLWSASQENPPNPGNDLYRYDASSGELSDLTVGPAPNGADVLGILGTSADGSTVYFAANGDLDGAGPAVRGDCEGAVSGSSLNFKGRCSLYQTQEGTVNFVAPLAADGGDATNWISRGSLAGQTNNTARVTPDGETLLFRSQEKLTPYDNEGTPELYRYHVGEGIVCVSCNPSGEAPSGRPGFGSIELSFLELAATSQVLSRNLSTDGNKVFFQTTDALVGADVNGLAGCPLVGPAQGLYSRCLDVYEWEAEETGSCRPAEAHEGDCLYLLSTGTSPDASYILDASATGDDVFLATRSQLVGQDKDELFDVYDAHVGGGLASQNETKVICQSQPSCLPAPAPEPSFDSPGTASFNGPGNPKAKAPTHKKGKKHKAKGKKRKKSKKHRLLDLS